MSDPILGMRFSVLFLAGGVVPNPLDIRFQRVSGLSAEVETEAVSEGGQNLYTQRVPRGIKYNNLVLERGMVVIVEDAGKFLFQTADPLPGLVERAFCGGAAGPDMRQRIAG